MNIKKILLYILFFFCYVNVFAFTTFPTATMVADKDRIDVGESVNVTINISIPSFAKLLQTENDIVVDGWDVQDFYFTKSRVDSSLYTLNLTLTTFDNTIKEIPKVRLTYVNKDDLLSDSFFCEKFYFFSNKFSINVDSIVARYNKESIFDIKQLKFFKISFVFYILCLFLFVFVIVFVCFRLLNLKARAILKTRFTSKEKSIKLLNQIGPLDDTFDENKIEEYYYKLSFALKEFVLGELYLKKTELTTEELIQLISKENNLFYRKSIEIKEYFKICDNAKYSMKSLTKNEFLLVYNKIKKFMLSFRPIN